ncbi:MAG: septum formation protein Maf [Pseudomonas fluorescens]|nr:MAG: septum formation protein Maf [Pseudomonas fluorescens]
MQLILASQSKYRKEWLQKLGVEFTTQPANVDESVLKNEAPLAYIKRVAIAKAHTISAANKGAIVLAADTPMVLGRRIIQTPQTEDEATASLRLQSGRRIHFPTVVVVVDAHGKTYSEIVDSWVKLKKLTEAEITAFIASGLWKNSAGGFKIEYMEPWILTTHGSVSGIMGLPLYETAKLLARAGVKVNPFA